MVYTSHSLEPNGGKEEEAIRELIRVARRAVVLIEPIYELASAEAQERMRKHGYVRGLKAAAERIGAHISDYRLLDYATNSLNPSGVIIIEKELSKALKEENLDSDNLIRYQCPLTHSDLKPASDVFVAEKMGIVYPILRGIPLLRTEHAVVASGCV